MDLSFDRLLGIFGVLGIFIGIGVAVAMDPKAKAEMFVAVGCFIFSGIALCATVGIWAFGTESFLKRLLVAGPFFLLTGVATVEASRWAYGRFLGVENTMGVLRPDSTVAATGKTEKSEPVAKGSPAKSSPAPTPVQKAEQHFLGVRSPTETTVLPPNSSAIISSHTLSNEERKDLDRLEAEHREAAKHWVSEPERLTVRDLFWMDFESPENNVVRHSGFTIRNGETGALTHISSAVIYQNTPGVKILAFHIPYTNETPRIAVSLAGTYKQPLTDVLESAVVTGKIATGDSEQVSSQNLVLSSRVFVYHDTYLSPEQVIEARNAWKNQGVTVIFRSSDYLENRKLEAKIKKLETR